MFDNPDENGLLVYHPAVCMSGKSGYLCADYTYTVIFVCRKPALASVTVGDMTFTDSVNGVMRSDTLIHRVTVPAPVLDKYRHYTVHIAPLADHCNYYPKPEPTVSIEYGFVPVTETAETVSFYVLADTHGDSGAPAEAASNCPGGIPDLLVLDGDIGDSADTPDMILTFHRLVSKVTGGTRPVVYARGNHDTRGHNAEHLNEYVPTCDGRTFYTFRAGPVWGIVLDAGEDKPDGCIEYGGVIDMPPFRRAQTAFLDSVIQNAKDEYAAPGVTHRIAVCHMPFMLSRHRFSQTTPDIYDEWIARLNQIGVEVMLCGHMHWIDRPDASSYTGPTPLGFRTVLCATMDGNPSYRTDRWIPGSYTGCHVVFSGQTITETFTNHRGEILPL